MKQQRHHHQENRRDETQGRSGRRGGAGALCWAALALMVAAASGGCASLDVPLVSTHDSAVQKAFAAQARTDDASSPMFNIPDGAKGAVAVAFLGGGMIGYVGALPATVALAPITWPLSKGVDNDMVIFAPNCLLAVIVGAAVAAPVFILTLPWLLSDD